MTRHRYRCPVRWGDMDAQRHVNNVAFLDYLQEARVDFLLSGPDEAATLLTNGVFVVSHQVEYLAPVVYSGRGVDIELWVDAVGGSRFVVGYEVFDGDVLALRARTAAVPFDLAGGGLRRLTPAERAALQAVAERAEPLRPVTPSELVEPAHHTDVRVRWSDLDSYGHVNNVTYAEYVQQARIQLLHDTVGWPPEGHWVVARQDLEYRRPMDFRRTPFRVRTAVAAVGTRSFTLAVDIVDPGSGVQHALGRTVVVGTHPLGGEQRANLARYASTTLAP